MKWNEILTYFFYDENNPILFHQGFFLFLFSCFLIGYSLVKKYEKSRFIFLAVFSLYFYYKASGWSILLLLSTIYFDYLISFFIEKVKKEWHRKLVLFFGISISLASLFYFKYKNFVLGNFNDWFGSSFQLEELILPIGISFYTFQSISYMVDVYGKKVERPSFFKYLIYMIFFPHLVAGPIVRAKEFIPQLDGNSQGSSKENDEALGLIMKGFIKKAIIADFVAQYSDIVFSEPSGFSGSEHFLASLCYSLQIFCDFSGYTDMAIGIALLLGYRLGLNFNSPYQARSITEFWRRWHISLSTWLRDYLYIPLGGNKKGFFLQLVFLLITMLLGGFWHGADWKFIFWGVGHGLLLVAHKLWLKYFGDKKTIFSSGVLSIIITFFLVNLLWIPFRVASIEDTLLIYQKIFTDFNVSKFFVAIENNQLLFSILVFGYLGTLLSFSLKEKMVSFFSKQNLVLKFCFFIIIIQAFIQIQSEEVHPFIYFSF